VGDIAVAVLAAVDAYAGEPTMFGYAGDSLGGAVGLQLMLDTPERVAWAVLCCTGPRIGEPEGWRDRVAAVRSGGTAALLDSATRTLVRSRLHGNAPHRPRPHC
jgi:pimeloyl-ACP methyl ester carboxylesterase